MASNPKPALMKAIHLKQLIRGMQDQMYDHLKNVTPGEHMVLEGDTVYKCSWFPIGYTGVRNPSFSFEEMQVLR